MDDQDFLQQCGDVLLKIDKLPERHYKLYPLFFGTTRDRLAELENKVLGGHTITLAMRMELETIIARVDSKIACC